MNKVACERCGGNTDIMVQAVIVAPSSYYHEFSKKMMRDSKVHFNGVLWETADFICKNPDCGCVSNGYGNYVTNLKKENELQSVANAELTRALQYTHHVAPSQLEKFVKAALASDWDELATFGFTKQE